MFTQAVMLQKAESLLLPTKASNHLGLLLFQQRHVADRCSIYALAAARRRVAEECQEYQTTAAWGRAPDREAPQVVQYHSMLQTSTVGGHCTICLNLFLVSQALTQKPATVATAAWGWPRPRTTPQPVQYNSSWHCAACTPGRCGLSQQLVCVDPMVASDVLLPNTQTSSHQAADTNYHWWLTRSTERLANFLSACHRRSQTRT
jgi:hypothetical protein